MITHLFILGISPSNSHPEIQRRNLARRSLSPVLNPRIFRLVIPLASKSLLLKTIKPLVNNENVENPHCFPQYFGVVSWNHEMMITQGMADQCLNVGVLQYHSDLRAA